MKTLAVAVTVTLLALAGTLLGAPATSAAWPQWGGPNRNFVTGPADLAMKWPETGPRRIWQRASGDGFSSIVTDGATLYTLYRDGADDVAVAVDAKTGQTQWTTHYAAPFRELCTEQLGPAPRSAPLIEGDRVVTVSAGGLMNSFDRFSGQRKWTFDLLEGTPDALRACGYSSSPLAYRNTIITTAGGIGRGVNGDFGSAPFAAIDILTGEMAWRDRRVSRSTLIGVGNRLVILDEDGNLALATPRESGLEVHLKAQILSERSWTVPTLSGTTLYLRDRHHITAVDLGK